MPWKVADVDKFRKGLTPEQKVKWVNIANNALARCIKDGGTDKLCAPSAIKIANSAMEESIMSESTELVEVGKVLSAANETKMRAAMAALQAIMDDMMKSSPEVKENLEEATTKTEDGKSFPASDYAYVPDPESPSTWKLRLTATPGGEPDSGVVGAAAAALGPGFRGQKVSIPGADLAKVKATVRAAWRKANPDKDTEDMPSGIRESSEFNQDIVLDYVPLVEKGVQPNGTVPIKIIQPGWGSSGYYSSEVLKRDGPAVFTSGLKMFWDHPTAAEESARPERSLRDLAGEFVTDAKWEETGSAGPGLYANAKVFGQYKDVLSELAPHIGVSIRATGKAVSGEAEGRKGPLIERIAAAKSVDFVTAPGAGGKVVSLFESARSKEVVNVDDSELKALKETLASREAELVRLREAQILREAHDFVSTVLSEIKNLPELTRIRLVAALGNRPVIKDGKLDEAGYKTIVLEEAKNEIEYLSKATGAGKISGMGAAVEAKEETENQKILEQSFRRLGLSESSAKIAAVGRR